MLISVVIPTYNQEKYLSQSIQSVLNQTYSSIEILIVNDGSTDNTRALLTEFQSRPGIRIFHQENKGLSAARNLGIRHARGAFIALLDSDDLMAAERLQKQYDALQAGSNLDIVYTAVTLIDEEGTALGTMRRESIPPENFLAEEFFRNQVPSPSTIMTKRAVFQTNLFDENLRFGEDLEWILRTAHQDVFHYLDTPLTCYRRHQGNISENLEQLRGIELNILHAYGVEHISACVESSGIQDKPLLKGKILYVMGCLEEASEFLKQSENPLALFYQGNCSFEQGHYQTAVRHYHESLSQQSENAACWNNLGVALLQIGEVAQANQVFAKAMALNPRYLDPKYKRFTRRELRKDLLHYSKS
ncbi:putative glycosyl transferase [Waddlia chondrophila 2032/99]|uniref:Putative glycosyl transferase n=1 Tax=Waddlia chondrophila 2032/99 TaxID=765953 RepID=F8LDJ9_9BACT|nr:putative glycosyl transferase [Waddlia chondrophila 2032/99]